MYAVGVSRGMITEPIFLGRRWGVGYIWTEAVAYSGVSLGLAYCGWFRKPREELQVSGAAVTTLGEQPEIIH